MVWDDSDVNDLRRKGQGINSSIRGPKTSTFSSFSNKKPLIKKNDTILCIDYILSVKIGKNSHVESS